MQPDNRSSKKWKKEFDTRRKFKEDKPYIETLGKSDRNSNPLKIFLGNCGGKVPSCRRKEILEFCENLNLRTALQALLEQSSDEARSCLLDSEFDENGNATVKSRRYTRRLTDHQLCELLKEPVSAFHVLISFRFLPDPALWIQGFA